jgi:hypothetical protein
VRHSHPPPQPFSAWLCLRQDVFDQLYQFKVRHGLPTWEQAIERLLALADRFIRSRAQSCLLGFSG